MTGNIVIHLPHSSLNIPQELRNEILLDDAQLEYELLKITDRYTDELFNFDGAVFHRHEHSRLVFDPERFRDDADEVMSACGMGAVYVNTVDGRVMRKINPERREEILREYYDPYHKTLEEKVQKALDTFGSCLIIDGHSFPGKPLPFELDQNPDRPDICIGTCDFHTPEKLVSEMEEYIEGHGFTTRRNSPFAGTMVPMKYYKKDKRVSSVMIEVNRRLYMNETTGDKLPAFDNVRSFLRGLLEKMAELHR